MKKICAMASTIFCLEKPGQSIRQLRTAGIQEVMFDFGLIVSPMGILLDRNSEKPGYKPDRIRKYYRTIIEQLEAHKFLPSLARLPFIDAGTVLKDAYEYGELNDLILQVGLDCIKACEEIGCENIIIQPLFAGVERGQEWTVNREFYMELASKCKKEETKILLTNLCHDHNGHLVRGICADGAEAADWIDLLNQETGGERFGFCLDIGNCNLCGQDIQHMARALGGRLDAVILTENDGSNTAKLLPFTSAYGRSSTQDWLGVVRGLRECMYDGYLILDTVDTTVAFSPLLQPYLFPIYKAMLDYFEMQIALERDLQKYEQIALFGAGNMCRNYMKCYGEKYPPLFTCDNNPKLWGMEFEGLKVNDPEELKNLPEGSGVIICNIFYREIEEQLHSMGIENISYFNDEYMPSYYFDRLKRVEESDE